MTDMVNDCLWGKGWQNISILEKFSHVCKGFKVNEFDPAAIFLYQEQNPPFTMYHFMAHMVIM